MADWSHLPSDLLNLIGTHLSSQFDHLRFRSVCSTWRLSLSPLPSPCLSILPNNGFSDTSWGFYLSKRTILSLSSPLFPSQSWLVKIEQDNPVVTHLVNPLTSSLFDLKLGFRETLDLGRIGGSGLGSGGGDSRLTREERSQFDCDLGFSDTRDSTQIGVSQSGSDNGNSTLDREERSQFDQNLGFPDTPDLAQIGVSQLGSDNGNSTLTREGRSQFDQNLGFPDTPDSAQIGVSQSGSDNGNSTLTRDGRSQFDQNFSFPNTLDSTQIGVSQSGLGNENSTLTREDGLQSDRNLGFPKTLDLMPIRVSELGFEYILRYINYRPFASSINDAGNLYMEKVALLFDSRIGYVLLTIHVSGKLAMFKVGDKKWTVVEKTQSPYDDVALFDGRFYAVDNTGRLVVVNLDPSNDFSPTVELMANPTFGGDKKTMVVSGEDLLMIDTYLSVGPEDDMGFEDEVEFYEEFDCYMSERTVRFKVFRLDWGGKKWDEVKDLGDTMLFLGDYCTFSALASDFDGCKGNCIIFADRTFYSRREEEVGVVKGRGVGVFDLESGNIGFWESYPGYMKMFWPPPSWVSSSSSSTTLEDGMDQLRI